MVEQARGRLPGSNATCDKNIHVRGSNRKQFVMNKNIKESLVAVRVGVETNKDVLLTGRVNQSKTVLTSNVPLRLWALVTSQTGNTLKSEA